MDGTPDSILITPAAEAPPVPIRKQNGGVALRLRAVTLGLIVPICLLVIWDLAVRWTGTRLVPSPYGVGLMMWDFAFGGIYDDAL